MGSCMNRGRGPSPLQGPSLRQWRATGLFGEGVDSVREGQCDFSLACYSGNRTLPLVAVKEGVW